MPRWLLTSPMTQQGQANRLRRWRWLTRVVVRRPAILFCPSRRANCGVVSLPFGSPPFAGFACGSVGEVSKRIAA